MVYRTKQKGKVDQNLICLPKEHGGTSANNSAAAAANLKLVTNDRKNIPFGVAGINSNNKIDPAILPPGIRFDGSVNISGPISLSINQIQSYTITDYDINTIYTITAIGGSVSRSGSTITYTAPGVTGPSGFIINGKTVTIAISTALVITPSITSPSTGSSNMLGSLSITGTSFTLSSGTDVHEGSDWQIALDVGFTNIFSQVTYDTVNKTTWNVNSLAANTTYYARVRYKGTVYGYSDWSSIINFTTKSVFAPNAEKAILVASDLEIGGQFGWSVDIDGTGTRVVIGASSAATSAGNDSGKAYIFTRSGTSWTQEQILIASDRSSSDFFGQSVSIDDTGTRVVVGAYNHNTAGVTSAGQAYIFIRSGTVWTQEQIISASNKSINGHFGTSVAMDSTGTRVVIGAIGAIYNGTIGGAAYVFTRSGTSWTQEQILIASDRSSSDFFGQSVAMDSTGTRVVIGAIGTNGSSVSSYGKAYVFTRSGSAWSQEQSLVVSDKSLGDFFGTSVAIDGTGTRVVVGATGADPSGIGSAGQAYVFTRSGTVWTQEQILSASNKSINCHFGWSVAIDDTGTRVVVGAVGAMYNGTNGGAAYVFTRSGTVWTQEQIIVASDRYYMDNFGWSVAIDDTGTRVVVGAVGTNGSSVSSYGKAYVFTRSGSAWSQEQSLVVSDKSLGDFFGTSVAIDGTGTRVVVGATGADPSGIVSAGQAYVFTRSGTVWTQEQILSASDKTAGDKFGSSVSITGDGSVVVVGAFNDYPGGMTLAGSAYMYIRTGVNWAESNKLVASNKTTSAQFGNSCSLSSDSSRCIIGSFYSSNFGIPTSGSAYIFG